MRTQRQFRNLDSIACFLLLQQEKKRQGSMKSLPMSITILGSTGQPEAVGQKAPQRK